MTERNKTLIFTGGHHTSSLVVANALKNRGWNIFWFGHRHSMWSDKSDSAEYREVTGAGINFMDLKAGKLYRTYNPLKLIRLPFGFLQALFYILKLNHETDLRGIVSFGGYLAVPTVFSGWFLGLPSLTHEQTVAIGWANRFLTPFVKKIAISWPSSQKYYPQGKTVLTGLPLRPEILRIKNNSSDKKIKTIYITGGKQGSHIINQLIFDSLPQLINKYKVIHQTGSSTVYHDFQKAQSLIQNNYEVFDFDSQKALLAFSQADLVISRAGAHTVYELAVMAKPCILIPLSWGSHNEQTRNARLLEANRQAVILPEAKLTSARLQQSISIALSLKFTPLQLTQNGLENLVHLIESTFTTP